jgi:hypothetical protein
VAAVLLSNKQSSTDALVSVSSQSAPPLPPTPTKFSTNEQLAMVKLASSTATAPPTNWVVEKMSKVLSPLSLLLLLSSPSPVSLSLVVVVSMSTALPRNSESNSCSVIPAAYTAPPAQALMLPGGATIPLP